MAEPKTRKSSASVSQYLANIEDEQRRKDCQKLDRLMSKITGKKAALWGTSIVGYDSYQYTYARGDLL